MGQLLKQAIERQDWETVAIALLIGLVRAWEFDQATDVQRKRWRITKAGHGEHLEAIETLSSTAFTRTP